MKKYVTGIAVLVLFGIYSLGIRHISPIVGKPASLKKNSGSTKTAPSSNVASGTTATTNTSSSSTVSSGTSSPTTSSYKDGTYKGSVANAYYGNVQVAVTISGSKITDVKFLQYPNSHQTSVIINQQAMPYLKQETIQSQSSNVQIISGATFTSQAFQQSLQSALSQA